VGRPAHVPDAPTHASLREQAAESQAAGAQAQTQEEVGR
jgi:hypothetical protein